MSTTEGRKHRMEILLQVLRNNRGLEVNEIAHKTRLLTEISMDRLYKYLAELEFSGLIYQHDLKYHIVHDTSMESKRERKTTREKKGGADGKGENAGGRT